LSIIFIILKHLNYPSSIINRNPTYFFFLIIFVILKHLNYPSSIINRNPTYFFLIIFVILKHLNYPSSILNRNPTFFLFFNYFYNFKTFKLSFKYPKHKSYILFFTIIFLILKHLNYPSSIINRNPTYFFFINYFYNFKTFKLSFKYHKQNSYFLFL
jgi:hypothetical protein